MSFADNLAALPATEQLAAITLTGPDSQQVRIENVPGSQGSVRIYAWLLGKYGVLNRDAAAEGLELYAEHTVDAASHPGKHPNIDRLLAIQAEGRDWYAQAG